MNITLETLTNSISLKTQAMMQELKNGNIKQAEEIADTIGRMIYNFRRLSEELKVEEVL